MTVWIGAHSFRCGNACKSTVPPSKTRTCARCLTVWFDILRITRV